MMRWTNNVLAGIDVGSAFAAARIGGSAQPVLLSLEGSECDAVSDVARLSPLSEVKCFPPPPVGFAI
jgi:hypothetical protein